MTRTITFSDVEQQQDGHHADPELISQEGTDEYIRLDVEYSADIKVGEKEFRAVWQNGGFYDGDYSCPSNRLELSDGGGTDDVIIDIDNVLDDDELHSAENAKRINDEYDTDFSVAEIVEIHTWLRDERPNFGEHHSEDVDDYVITKDDETGEVTVELKG